MQILIKTDPSSNMVGISKDYREIHGRGEVAHIICELKLMEQELLEIWTNLPS